MAIFVTLKDKFGHALCYILDTESIDCHFFYKINRLEKKSINGILAFKMQNSL